MSIFKKLSKIFILSTFPVLSACTTVSFPTVSNVDLDRFMGTWYVSAGRFTYFEKDVHNAIENYKYDEKTKTILIDFTYRQGSPTGKEKKLPQTGEVVEGTQNAHWLVSPFWPLKFDYLIIAMAEDYSWVAIGVPSQKYLWIMHRKTLASREEINLVIDQLRAINYNVDNIEFVPQKWD
jgi:apolipoprotein D and lipocalin family protein